MKNQEILLITNKKVFLFIKKGEIMKIKVILDKIIIINFYL